MKSFLSELLAPMKWLGRVAASSGEAIRRACTSSEARQREDREAERLDRIRNQRDYEGK
jgi:hypothetical protein